MDNGVGLVMLNGPRCWLMDNITKVQDLAQSLSALGRRGVCNGLTAGGHYVGEVHALQHQGSPHDDPAHHPRSDEHDASRSDTL